MSVTQNAQQIEKMAGEKEAFFGRIMDGAKALKNRFLETAESAGQKARQMGGSAGRSGDNVYRRPGDTPKALKGETEEGLVVQNPDEIGEYAENAAGGGSLFGGYGSEIGAGAAGAGAGAAGMEMMDEDKEASSENRVRERFGLSSDTNKPDHPGRTKNRFSRSLA